LKQTRNFADDNLFGRVRVNQSLYRFAGEGNFKVVSLAEKKIIKLLDSELEKVAQYTRNVVIRTYPDGTRTNSSNYNPVSMWCGGCQVGKHHQ